MAELLNKKLGRRAVKTDSRTPKMASYLSTKMPDPLPSCDWTRGVTSWGQMLNDQLGCCTIAARGHAIQTWTLNSGQEITIPDSEILADYEQFCGYNPADPNSDQGGIEQDVLLDWTKLPATDYPLAAYMTVNPQHTRNVKLAINLFGGLYIGIALPNTIQDQQVWDVVPNGGPDAEPGSLGGHAVWVPKYGGDNRVLSNLTCITWGGLQEMTVAFWLKYVDEAYALLSPCWFGVDQLAPSGFKLADLEADLKAIR